VRQRSSVSKRRMWLGVSLIAALALVIADLLMLRRGGEKSPEDAARAFAEATLNQDCDAYLSATTRDSWATLGDTRDAQLAGCERLFVEQDDIGPSDLRLGPISVESRDDDVARVWVVLYSEDYEAGNNAFAITSVYEDGEWRVDPTAEDWGAED
jgi:hypothetical protein